MFYLEYYEAASQDWYTYGEETFATQRMAECRLEQLLARDPYSRRLSLRVSRT